MWSSKTIFLFWALQRPKHLARVRSASFTFLPAKNSSVRTNTLHTVSDSWPSKTSFVYPIQTGESKPFRKTSTSDSSWESFSVDAIMSPNVQIPDSILNTLQPSPSRLHLIAHIKLKSIRNKIERKKSYVFTTLIVVTSHLLAFFKEKKSSWLSYNLYIYSCTNLR